MWHKKFANLLLNDRALIYLIKSLSKGRGTGENPANCISSYRFCKVLSLNEVELAVGTTDDFIENTTKITPFPLPSFHSVGKSTVVVLGKLTTKFDKELHSSSSTSLQ